VVLVAVAVTSHLAYLVLFALVGAESAGVPVPGEAALIVAALTANHGRLEIELVIAVAAAGAIAGDNAAYVLGRTGGRRLLERPGFMERRRRAILVKGEPFFIRHGAKAVFFGRWFTGLRIAVAWLAGINRMRWPVFLFWNALGGIAWSASIGLLAFYLGPVVERVVKDLGYAGIAVALLVGGYLVWRRRQRLKAQQRTRGQRP